MTKEQGFTLLELMVAVTILGIVLSIAMPSMSDFMDKRRVINAAEAVYSEILYARSESVARSLPVFINLSGGGTDNWRLGVSTTGSCDPTITDVTDATACVIVIDDGDGNIHGEDPDGDGTTITDNDDLVLRVLSSTDFSGVELSSTGGEVEFDPTRGILSSGNSTITLSYAPDGDTTYDVNVVIAMTGRALMCSPIYEGRGVPGYSQCD